MLQINPKKFKHIHNKTIPSPLRPKFRNKAETNIYFLSKRKFNIEKRQTLIKNLKILKIKQFPHLWDLNSEIKLKQISISSQKENFKAKKNSQCSEV